MFRLSLFLSNVALFGYSVFNICGISEKKIVYIIEVYLNIYVCLSFVTYCRSFPLRGDT